MWRTICTTLNLCSRPKEPSRVLDRRVWTRKIALAVAAALGLVVIASNSEAEAQVLGATEAFAVLGASTVTNTGPTILNGDLGVYAGTAITGFFGTVEDDGPGIVNGAIHQTDGVAQTAQGDATTLFNVLMGLPSDFVIPAQLGGSTLVGGVYEFAGGAAQITGVLTLDGQNDPNSLWDFKIASTLTTATGSAVILIRGADPNNVFWAVGSSATLGASSVFQGTIVADQSISFLNAASIVCGRAIALVGAVTMINNTVTVCASGGNEGDITEDELGGEGVSGTQETAFDASRLFGSAMLAHTVFPYLAVGAPGPGSQTTRPEKYTPLKVGPSESEVIDGDYYYQPRRWRAWAAGLGGSSSLDGNKGSGTLDNNVGGMAAGLDYRFNPTALIGIAGGFTESDFSVDQLNTDGTVHGAHVGLYGVKSFGMAYLAGTAEYANFNNKTDRILNFVVDERAKGNFDSNSFGGRLEAGWRRPFGRHFVTPFIGVDAYKLETDGFTENSQNLNGGPGILGLTFKSDSVTSVTSSLGIQFDTQYALAYDRVLSPFVRVAWVHEYNPERSVESFLTASPAASFIVDGASAAEDVARVDAGLRLDLSERIALWGFFEGEFGDRTQSYAGVGGGDVAFAGSGEGQNYSGRVGMKVRW